MFESLAGSYPIVWIVNKELLDQVGYIWTHMRYELCNPCAFRDMWKVEFHVSGILLKLIKQFF